MKPADLLQRLAGEFSGDLFKEQTVARMYDYFLERDKYDAGIDALLNLAPFSSDDVVLDVGCGTGISTTKILERNPKKIVGVDFSQAMLQEASQKFVGQNKVYFVNASADVLPVKQQSVDKIVCANVFRYFQNPLKVLQEMYAILKPQGYCLFNVPLQCHDDGRQSIAERVLRAIEQVLKEETDHEIHFPQPKIFSSPYDKARVESLTTQTGFKLVAYEEWQGDYTWREIHRFETKFVIGFENELEKSVGKEKANYFVGKVYERLRHERCITSLPAGKEGRFCVMK